MVAQHKTVTPQTLIGEEGVNLIERRVLEMGHLFHPRRIDHGIDGHIDLVEPGTGRHLNQTILVQSKAHDRSLQQESSTSFVFTCDQRDLEHWLAGNAPVIVVVSHPKRDEAWWIDVKAAFAEPKTRAARRLLIDKASHRFDRDAGPAVMRLGMPVSSGLYLQPPPRREVLDTNLLKIVSLPDTIYLAPALTSEYPAAGKLLESASGSRPQFLLRDGLILSLSSIRDSRLSILCNGDVEAHSLSDWAESSEIATRYSLHDLLLRTIQGGYPELRWHNSRKHLHFRATRDMEPRKVGKRKGAPGRTVFGPHLARDGSVGYYRHAAVKMRMRYIGHVWFAEITPDYCFTSDGQSVHRYEEKLLAGIKRLDRHAAVAGWVRTWAEFLRGSDDLFSGSKPIQFGDLVTVEVECGIDDRYWGPTLASGSSETSSLAEDDDDAELDNEADEAEIVDDEVIDLLSLLAEADFEGGASVASSLNEPDS